MGYCRDHTWDILSRRITVQLAASARARVPTRRIILPDATRLQLTCYLSWGSEPMNTMYLILNLIVLGLFVLVARKHIQRPSRALILTTLCVVALTAVFDPLIIAAGIVDYNPSY